MPIARLKQSGLPWIRFAHTFRTVKKEAMNQFLARIKESHRRSCQSEIRSDANSTCDMYCKYNYNSVPMYLYVSIESTRGCKLNVIKAMRLDYITFVNLDQHALPRDSRARV